MKTITTIEEVLAVVDPETVLLDGKCRSYQWSLTMGGEEGWCSVDDPTPITSHHLLRFGPLKVIHCTIPTAADQPTTEPSVLDEALAALRGYFGLRLPIEGGVLVPVAHLHALYEALVPAPQPAADTETEVQWGVQYGDEGEMRPASSEEGARRFVRIRPGWVVVKRHVTPWEDA